MKAQNSKVFVPMEFHQTDSEVPGLINMARASYLRKLYNYGLEPVLVPPISPDSLVDKEFERCSGLLLMGGHDINPSNYGEEKHAKTVPSAPERDAFEMAITKRAIESRLPLLGICRGCQVLNVANGGNLFQHVPDLMLDVSDPEKHDSPSANYDHVSDTIHAVKVVEGTRFHKMLKKDLIEVNSGHHQAIKDLASDFIGSGHSSDGTIELIEHKDHEYFCFATQSHPELYKFGDLEPVFEAFSVAVKNHQK